MVLRPDRGSVVAMALVTMLIGTAAIAGLTSFTIAVTRAQTSRERRIELERAAENALVFTAASLRRRPVDPAEECPSPPSSNEPTVDADISTIVVISCSTVGTTSDLARAGLVTTLNSSSISAQQIPPWAGDISDAVAGAIVVNTGTQASPGVSILADRRTPQLLTPTWSVTSNPWSTYVSSVDRFAPESQTPAPAPPLPPVPLYERPGSQASIGSCTIYFPGRYSGSSSLVLSGGSHYFTSGVYYFERSLTITNGARVVMGGGIHEGCTDDDSAVATSRSPRRHQTEGRGATILFGGTARLFVQNSSLIVNLRSGDERVALRTISHGISTSSVSVPEDVVRLEDGSVVSASSHSRLPPESATAVAYKASTLVSASDVAVTINLSGANVDTNRVIIPGQILVPHGGVHLASTTSSYSVTLTGGVVTTRLTSSIPNAPNGPESGFELGFRPTESSATFFSIQAAASDRDHTYTVSESFDTSNEPWSVVARSRRMSRSQ